MRNIKIHTVFLFREIRSASKQTVVFLLCMVLSLGSITAFSGLSQNINQWFFNDARKLHGADIIIRSNIFYGFVLAAIVVVVFALLFKYAKVGVAMRATASDQAAAFSMGINVKSMFTLSWAFGAIAASLGGIIIGNIGGVHPSLGHIGLKIFPVVILGGMDSIGGAVLGGFIVGIVENIAGAYLDPYFHGGVKDIAPFVVLVVILLIKPYGLFGKQEIERL